MAPVGSCELYICTVYSSPVSRRLEALFARCLCARTVRGRKSKYASIGHWRSRYGWSICVRVKLSTGSAPLALRQQFSSRMFSPRSLGTRHGGVNKSRFLEVLNLLQAMARQPPGFEKHAVSPSWALHGLTWFPWRTARLVTIPNFHMQAAASVFAASDSRVRVSRSPVPGRSSWLRLITSTYC